MSLLCPHCAMPIADAVVARAAAQASAAKAKRHGPRPKRHKLPGFEHAHTIKEWAVILKQPEYKLHRAVKAGTLEEYA